MTIDEAIKLLRFIPPNEATDLMPNEAAALAVVLDELERLRGIVTLLDGPVVMGDGEELQ